MPKKNVYVPDEMGEWMAEHPEVPYSRIFQEQIKKVMLGEDIDPTITVKVRRARFHRNEVTLRPGENIVAIEGPKERLIAVIASAVSNG